MLWQLDEGPVLSHYSNFLNVAAVLYFTNLRKDGCWSVLKARKVHAAPGVIFCWFNYECFSLTCLLIFVREQTLGIMFDCWDLLPPLLGLWFTYLKTNASL